MRTGILAQKIGMSRLYLEDRKHSPVTILRLEDCQVLGKKTEDKDGYNAVVLGFGSANIKKTKKPQREYFSKSKIEAKRQIKEFRVSKDNFVDLGKKIIVSHFVVGQYIDVSGNSIGKGFAGAMKRHNFAGLRASHGVSVSHRSHGSTGNSQDPGRVWKGKKMAGHMGNKQVTKQNLEVISIDEERGLILVKGAVPGSKGSWVSVTDARKKTVPANAPFPAGVEENKIKKEALKEQALVDVSDGMSADSAGVEKISNDKPEVDVNKKEENNKTDNKVEKNED